MRYFAILATSLALGVSAPVAAQTNEVRIGVLYPTSGPAAKSGTEGLEAIKLAYDIVNGSYDIPLPFAKTEGLPNKGGIKIRLIIEDHGGRPERGAAIAERMITEEKVHLLSGAFHSAVAAPASQVAEKYGIPFVTGGSEAPTLTERGFKTFFSVTPTTEDIARDFFAFLDDLRKEKGVPLKNLSVIHVNDNWGSSLAKAAEGNYKKNGFDKLTTISYPAQTADLRSEVLRLKSDAPDILLQASFDSDAILAVRTYQALGFTPKGILAMGASFASPDFMKALGKNADYAFSHTKFDPSLIEKRRAAAAVSKLYEARSGRSLWDVPAREFTAALVIADALNRAKSLSPEDIIQALRETNIDGADTVAPYKGIRFNEKGQNVLATGLITQIQDGKHYPVWPKDLSTKAVVFPAPGWDKR
ncbi:MAG TPA: ABC transporter substrate-binding protein [Burkholderiales bacterium]|nr:ABC transporter substrate-binding protein [Burkholderiales bacterium]